MKRKFFNHLISLSHNFHTSHKTGSLISRLIRGGGAIERMSDVIFFNFAPMVFQLIVASISLIYFDYISAIVVVLTVIIFIAYNLFFQTIQQEANLIANDTEDREKANISDIFTNVDSIKYFGKENAIKAKFAKLAESTRYSYLKNWDYFRFLDGGEALILGLGTFFLVYFPLVNFLSGGITIGTLVFIYTVYTGLIGSMFGFVYGIRNYYRSMADFDDLFQYAKIENEIKDKPGAGNLGIKEGEIEFRNVSFSYGNRKIFSVLNLKIPKNKKIALVGPSGSGKTTLIKLLYRFYDLDSGKILIDNKDIANFKQESVRSEMSIVPQECVLFDDAVYNNIAFSNPRASKEQVMKAIKFAQLDKTIINFPKKEKTIVGERGVKLSGGEKQRVSIARAILANKKILVLDEATSSLDSKTEFEIQQALAKLMEGRTSIIIAHRLSTIMNADKIIVMKKGKIVQEGTHNELIKQDGEYKRLWSLQKGGYIK
jgi:ATP-binding cassette subfamily B protein